MNTWIKSQRVQGVRYREHATRKHGVQRDKYITIFYKWQGRMIQESLGWMSQGWTEKKAAGILAQLQENQRRGIPPFTLKEQREAAQAAQQAVEAEHQKRVAAAITFGEVWTDRYSPQAKADKTPETVRRELNLYKKWIAPVLARVPIKDVSPFQIERIKSAMAKGGAAPRSIELCLAVIRQVINHSLNHGIHSGDNPVKRVKKPKFDNRRQRFLSPEEADHLLEAIRKRSLQTYQLSVFAYHAGLRANEVFSLQWQDVDLENGLLHIRDTKSRHDRVAFITEDMREILDIIGRGAPSDLLFVNDIGSKIDRISNSFQKAVDDCGFNAGVTDPREKVVFHTWRHSFASQLVSGGTDLFIVQKLLGHQTAAMTQRYSHLGDGQLREAVQTFQQSIKKSPKGNTTVKLLHDRANGRR